ncbi:hypothetical protein CISIN_1g040182mg [Citrus sinensis]|uniref:Uncharacterized protein n=1 Tax=Citrus sinensis TaxID=2711 RepID=A0A067DJ81_CITSI|nr:hypothetical protein CISIN_1g040182mg [Citrus sinensis]
MAFAGFSHNSYSLDLVWYSWLIFVAVLSIGVELDEMRSLWRTTSCWWRIEFKFVDVLLNWACTGVLLSMAIVIEKYHGCGVLFPQKKLWVMAPGNNTPKVRYAGMTLVRFLPPVKVCKRNHGRWPLGIMPKSM